MIAIGNEQGPVVSGPVLLILLASGAVVYGLGFAHAVWRRARLDFRATKAAVPKMRKAKWTLWAVMIWRGGWVLVVIVALLLWVVADIRAKQ